VIGLERKIIAGDRSINIMLVCHALALISERRKIKIFEIRSARASTPVAPLVDSILLRKIESITISYPEVCSTVSIFHGLRHKGQSPEYSLPPGSNYEVKIIFAGVT
jgi:hypothetical protein